MKFPLEGIRSTGMSARGHQPPRTTQCIRRICVERPPGSALRSRMHQRRKMGGGEYLATTKTDEGPQEACRSIIGQQHRKLRIAWRGERPANGIMPDVLIRLTTNIRHQPTPQHHVITHPWTITHLRIAGS